MLLACSGQTLYMEPEPCVALNNTEARLEAAQEEEENAILLRLSRQVGLLPHVYPYPNSTASWALRPGGSNRNLCLHHLWASLRLGG